MIQGFFWLSFFLVIILFAGIFWLKKYNSDMRTVVQMLFAMSMCSIFWNAVALVTDIRWLCDLAFALQIASIDWLLYLLMIFMQKYMKAFAEVNIVRRVVCIISIVDTISLIANTVIHHMFTTHTIVIFNNESCNTVVRNGFFYSMHLCFPYTMVTIMGISLGIRTFKTTKMYRKKYEMVFVAFVVVATLNMGYRCLHSAIDISPIIYFVLACILAYFSVIYIPKDLVEKLLSLSVSDMQSGIVCYDRDGKCVYANQIALKLFKVNKLDALEKFLQMWIRGRDIAKVPEHSWNEEHDMEDGKHYYEAQYRPLTDTYGNFLGCYFAMIDNTKDVMAFEIERYKATHDELTGIYNRSRFFERVREELENNPDVERYIIVSDIKEFKLVNDLFGEKRGDEILIKIAKTLGELKREDTVYGRLESDRFALCVRKEYYDEKILKGFVKSIEEMAKNRVFKMRIHLGVYQITDNTLEVSIMCDRALLAIEKIKDDYLKMISYYDEAIGENLHQENIMLSEFAQAMEEGQFKMFLQPQISSKTMELLGAEALIRWEHPERGMISPGMFIPLFEHTGYIYKLDRYIWECACKQLKKWQEMGKTDLHISVNVSPKDFYYIDIYDKFTELVEKYQINPKNLKIEITESAIMDNLSRHMTLMEKLKAYGFNIEIDDFGSGYSSLNTLKDMSADVLKLDMGFLSETDHNEKSRVIMNAIIDMAKNLGMLTVAEGVETLEQTQYLAGAGCDIFQGYYFSKPIPVDEFEKKYFQ